MTNTEIRFGTQVWENMKLKSKCDEQPNIMIMKDKYERKHFAYDFHSALKGFINDNTTNTLEKMLCKLLNRTVNLANATVSQSQFTIEYAYGPALYKLIEIQLPDLKLVFVDMFEEEQPGCTDSRPTPNPNFIELGVVLQNNHIFRIY